MAKAPTTQQISAACTLVGAFMLSWSFLEKQLNAAIKQIFRLEDLEGEIVVSNIQFRDKINIIRSSIERHSTHTSIKDDQWREVADKILGEIGEIATNYRNVIAHNPFFPDETGAVIFHRATARRKLRFPTLSISAAEFASLFERLDQLSNEVKRILAELEPAGDEALVAALLGMPTIGKALPNSDLARLLPQASPAHADHPANAGTSNQSSSSAPPK